MPEHEADPRDYPHTLTQDEATGRIFLETRQPDGTVKRHDLRGDDDLRIAYVRYRHLLEAHDRLQANAFLWGFLTGLGVTSIWQVNELVARRRRLTVEHDDLMGMFRRRGDEEDDWA